ncbi:hypothetical protein [Thalassoroseus pseudoceratinae]|uniref:hypothetical protein n=1 Tax=Thalassoroseus pseudoceratinae TaxID=2713176 RepID=UPI001421A2C3|nr:hypothetical protein [Thalassoroseus pseudoceratinae]
MSKNFVQKFTRQIEGFEVTRTRIEDQFESRRIRKRDVETLYEGLFLRAVVSFEDMLESVFFYVLYNKCRRKMWRPQLQGSRKTLRACVLQKQKYLDWLPINRTIERAQLFLNQGLPFSLLDDDDKSKLSQIVAIRNAVAHASPHSQETFKKKVVGSTPLPKSETSPAGFLRSIARTNPRACRYQIYVQSLGKAASKLA